MVAVGTAAVAAEQAVLEQSLLRKVPAAKGLCKAAGWCVCSVASDGCRTGVVVQT